jgi:hypothetical protein
MIDYIRRFGRFSRRFLASQVGNTMTPRLFDFIRYPGGVKPLPGIVTRPFALRSFAQLLPPCSAKKYIFQHLLSRTADEKVLNAIRDKETDISGLLRDAGRLDPQLGLEARVNEKMLKSTQRRPIGVEEIQSDIHLDQPASPEDIVAALEKSDSYESPPSSSSVYDLQFTQVQPFKSPLMGEETHALVAVDDDDDSQDHRLQDIYDEFGTEEPSWFAARRKRGNFFRFNGKAYRMVEGEGWKQVQDPRGELPDYARPKAFRDKKRAVLSQYSRIRRRKTRDATLKRIIQKKLSNS